MDSPDSPPSPDFKDGGHSSAFSWHNDAEATYSMEVRVAMRELGSEDFEVRQAAKDVLQILNGSVDAISVVCDFLKCDDAEVRRRAVAALLQVANKGNLQAVLSVSSLLKHPSWEIRREAMSALTQIAEQGDPKAIAAVSSLLEHEDVNIRMDGVAALTWLAGIGDPQAISVLSARLEDRSSDVRKGAISALAQIAECGDLQAIAAVSARLRHCDVDVKRDAVLALAQISDKGNPHTITALSACLQDESLVVRQEAMAALNQIAEKGDSLAISAVGAHLVQRGSVRREAVVALTRIDPHATTAIGTCLEHENPSVRKEAVVLLSQMAERGDMQATSMVRARLADVDVNVREAAAMALDKMAGAGCGLYADGDDQGLAMSKSDNTKFPSTYTPSLSTAASVEVDQKKPSIDRIAWPPTNFIDVETHVKSSGSLTTGEDEESMCIAETGRSLSSAWAESEDIGAPGTFLSDMTQASLRGLAEDNIPLSPSLESMKSSAREVFQSSRIVWMAAGEALSAPTNEVLPLSFDAVFKRAAIANGCARSSRQSQPCPEADLRPLDVQGFKKEPVAEEPNSLSMSMQTLPPVSMRTMAPDEQTQDAATVHTSAPLVKTPHCPVDDRRSFGRAGAISPGRAGPRLPLQPRRLASPSCSYSPEVLCQSNLLNSQPSTPHRAHQFGSQHLQDSQPQTAHRAAWCGPQHLQSDAYLRAPPLSPHRSSINRQRSQSPVRGHVCLSGRSSQLSSRSLSSCGLASSRGEQYIQVTTTVSQQVQVGVPAENTALGNYPLSCAVQPGFVNHYAVSPPPTCRPHFNQYSSSARFIQAGAPLPSASSNVACRVAGNVSRSVSPCPRVSGVAGVQRVARRIVLADPTMQACIFPQMLNSSR